LYLTSWEEGAKDPKGKSSWQELKANFETFKMLRPRIPKKAMKRACGVWWIQEGRFI
jgi:hypothetical protein